MARKEKSAGSVRGVCPAAGRSGSRSEKSEMNEVYLQELLEQVSRGETAAGDALEELKELPYKDLGFANVDHHRAIRTGFPEVIFSQGKKPEQIRDIFRELMGRGRTIMATRSTPRDYAVVREVIPEAVYYDTARIIAVQAEENEAREPIGFVTVVSAGTADIPVAEEAAVTAELLGNEVNRIYDVGVAGIHRLLDRLGEIREADVLICVAGMEGALASVLGGLVDAPVIAVPTSMGYGANLGGLSALLSMLNSCANGVSVVNIDNGFGGAYFASVINRKGK